MFQLDTWLDEDGGEEAATPIEMSEMHTMKRTLINTTAAIGLSSALVLAGLTSAHAAPSDAAYESPSGSLTAVAPSPDASITDSDEATRLAWWPIILGAIAVGGAVDAMGIRAAERVYYGGMTNAIYQEVKWSLRASVIGFLGPITGAIFMISFDPPKIRAIRVSRYIRAIG